MSLTPIEDPDRSGTEGGTSGESSGVRQRLRALVSRVTVRVIGAVAKLVPTSAGDDEGRRRARRGDPSTAIAPGWNGKLEGQRTRESPELPARRRGAHARETDGDVTATVEEDRLRIQHLDRDEEFISSDVYERIER